MHLAKRAGKGRKVIRMASRTERKKGGEGIGK
jgi:hypothetical protein